MEVISMTAPSSPSHLSGCYLSAPTSPRRFAEFYRDIDEASVRSDDGDDDFAFNIGEESQTTLFAEELFDGGKIKSHMKLHSQIDEFEESKKNSPLSSPVSHGKNCQNHNGRERGRERCHDWVRGSSRRSTRSVSPLRVSAYPWEEEDQEQGEQDQNQKHPESSLNKKGSSSLLSSISSKLSSSRKWRLRDLILFRSRSEGRAQHKYSSMGSSNFFKKEEDANNSSFRSNNESVKSRRSFMSAHEFYIAKKAESTDKKKKTFLPYKQIGRFAF